MNEAINLAKSMNTLTNLEKITIPVLDGFELEEINLTDPNHRTVFIAKKNNTLEQFFGDGALNENESFDDRVELVVKQMTEKLKKLPVYEGNNEFLVYYKNYDSPYFDFKIYIQDILTGTKEKIMFTRQLSAFFVEPQGNEFYQISVSAGKYAVSEEHKLLKDIEDYEKDEINIGLDDALTLIMDNITYRE